jgi:hypothetical protein
MSKLDETLKAEKEAQDKLESTAKAGVKAQADLTQVRAVVADLTGVAGRRDELAKGTDDRLTALAAKTKELETTLTDVNVSVDAMLAGPSVKVKVADLVAAVAANLVAPLDPAKKYDDYDKALLDAQTAFAVKQDAAAKAQNDAAKARLEIGAAETHLGHVLDGAAATADAAKAALADAVRAKAANDLVGAYWAQYRAKALLKQATDAQAQAQKAVNDAKTALGTAMDAYADATDKRVKAENEAAAAKEARDTAADQLGKAAEQVLQALRTKAKGP